jgi:hypothetical protein
LDGSLETSRVDLSKIYLEETVTNFECCPMEVGEKEA